MSYCFLRRGLCNRDCVFYYSGRCLIREILYWAREDLSALYTLLNRLTDLVTELYRRFEEFSINELLSGDLISTILQVILGEDEDEENNKDMLKEQAKRSELCPYPEESENGEEK